MLPTVTEQFDLPGGADPANVTVKLELAGTSGRPVEGFDTVALTTVVGAIYPTITAAAWTQVLPRNDQITPAGTVWKRTISFRNNTPAIVDYLTLTAAGTFRVDQVLTTAPASVAAPGAIASSVLTVDGDILTRASSVPARITRVALAADPAFSGTYDPLGAASAAQAAAVQRANHTGTQAESTITNLVSDLAAKVTYVGAPTGVAATDAATLQAAMDAGGEVRLKSTVPYNIGTTSLTYGGDNIALVGPAGGAATIRYTGSGAALKNSDPTVLRTRCGFSRLKIDLTGAGVGARGFECDNFTKGKFYGYINGTGLACTPLKLIGSATKSTYFNEFGLDLIGNTACVDLGTGCNRNRFIGGVWEGSGYSVLCQPATGTVDTCLFERVAMQTTGATIIQLGGGAGSANDHSFMHCNLEATAAVVCGTNALHNLFFGGSWSSGITRTRGNQSNVFIIPNVAIFDFARTAFYVGDSVDGVYLQAASGYGILGGSPVNGFILRADGGSNSLIVSTAHQFSFLDGANLNFGITTGTKIGVTVSDKLAFYGATPVAKQTGVAVTAAGIHAALVTLGLFA